MKKAHNKNQNINTISYTLLTALVVYVTFNETIICPSIHFISIIKFNDMFVLFKIFILETNVQHIKHIKYVLLKALFSAVLLSSNTLVDMQNMWYIPRLEKIQ